jgi:hypothetical protein
LRFKHESIDSNAPWPTWQIAWGNGATVGKSRDLGDAAAGAEPASHVQIKEIRVKRKQSAPRNPFVAAAKFKKAGAHGKSEKALRRASRIDAQREASLAARHRTFNPDQDGFDSLVSHQTNAKWLASGCFALVCSPVAKRVRQRTVNAPIIGSIPIRGATFTGSFGV